jgi:alkylation response protein AidB-like acyl-CoA dehydrogenase
VSNACVIGSPGEGRALLDRALDAGATLACAEASGAVARAFELTVDYAFDRHTFGRPLASYQALKHRFADMKWWLEACLGTSTDAARAVQADRSDRAEAVSTAKAYVGERGPAIVQDCVQLHGGIGVTWEHDLHIYLRRVLVDRLLYGDPTAHLERLGRRVIAAGAA